MTLAGILADPLAGRSVARGVRLIGWGVACAAWLTSLIESFLAPSFYPSGYQVVALVLLAAPLTGPLVGKLRTRGAIGDPVRELQAFVLVGTALHLVDAWVVTQPPGSTNYPPLNNVIMTAMVLAGIVLRPTVGAAVVTINCAIQLAQRMAVTGPAQALAEASVFAAAGFAASVLISTIRGELDRLAAATASALDAQTRADVEARRSHAQQRLDGLIHDKVLAALTLAARGRSGDAAALAEDALRDLAPAPPEASPGTPPPLDAAAIIADHARALGIELEWESEQWPDGAVGGALRAATCEALTNVSRHAGVGAASVRAQRRGHVFVVEVSDHGAGFDPASIPAGRLGVRERISGSLAAVGGEARVESSVGSGTRIILASPDDAPGTAFADEPWLPAVLLRIAPILALVEAGHIAAGSLHLADGVSSVTTVGGMITIPCLALLIGLLPPAGRLWRAAVVATPLVWGGLLANVADSSVIDWRFWFIGAFDPHLALISARRGVRQALLVIGVAFTLGWTGLLLRGQPVGVPLAALAFQSVSWAVCIGWLKTIADRASDRTKQALQLRQAAEVDAARASALQAEIAARQQTLDAEVIPLLRTIATQTTISDADRGRCRGVEAATRDQLVASTLLTPELVAGIADARAHGVRVTIIGRAEAGPALDAFRTCAVALLRLGRAKDRITLRWAPDADGSLATCVVVGAGVDALLLPPLSIPRAAVQVSVDTDSILLVIRAT